MNGYWVQDEGQGMEGWLWRIVARGYSCLQECNEGQGPERSEQRDYCGLKVWMAT